MLKDKEKIIYGIILLIFIYHLLTLSISPLPWFDEVYFANITDSYKNSGNFLLTVTNVDKEALYHGPVYFVLNSLVIEALGLSAYNFRLLNLIAGTIALCIFFEYFIVRKTKSVLISSILGGILFLDPIIILTLHSGRMEGVSFLFFVLAIRPLLALTNCTIPIRFIPLMISGLFVALSLLTTPRVIVLFLGLVPFFLFALYKKQITIIKLIFFTFIVFSVYLSWVFYKFEGILEFIEYNKTLVPFVSMTSVFIPFYEYPLLLTGVISILVLFVYKKDTKYNIYHNIIFISGIIFFHIIVKITSTAYYFYVIPLYIFFIAQFLDLEKVNTMLKYILIFCILTTNLGIFVAKTFEIFYSIEQRNPDLIEKFIEKNIEKNKKIGASFVYFYAVRNNECEFLSMEYGQHRALNEADYLIINKNSYSIDTTIFEKHTQLEMNVHKSFINKLIPFNISSTYEGTIYKRK